MQIIINTTHLEQACRYLEEFITNITNVSPETVHTTRLYGLSTFKVKQECLDCVLKFIKQCVFLHQCIILMKHTFPSGCTPCCRGRDLHQTEPEDRWVYPAGRLWVGHGWVRRPRLWIPHGSDQLPTFHLPSLYTSPGESDQSTSTQLKLSPLSARTMGYHDAFFNVLLVFSSVCYIHYTIH